MGSYLRAQATYTDNAKTPDDPDSDTIDESLDVTEDSGAEVTGVSVNAVQAEDTTNSAPVFPEGDDSETEDVVENNPVERSVDENSDPGDPVGSPVTATDVETPLPDALTYTLSGPDAALFTVEQDDPSTTADNDNEGGQINVGAGTKLDFETRTDYTVMVTATDPSNASATIMVNIMVADVDEVPVITVGPTTPPVTPTISVTGMATVDYDENGTEAVGTYISSEAGATWSLSGEDMDEFSISSGGVLEFTSPPDYEAETDANNDNVYMVTVTAMAAGAEDGSLEVAVTVTDVDEETPPINGNGNGAFDPLSYDDNENGIIDRPEVIQAIRDYFADMITRDDVIAVIQAYFGS